MILDNFLTPIEVIEFDSSQILLDEEFYPMNPAGLSRPCSIIRFINNSDEDLSISMDGVDQHIFVISGKTVQVDMQFNNMMPSNASQIPKGTIFYAYSLTANPVGLVYIAGYSSYRN